MRRPLTTHLTAFLLGMLGGGLMVLALRPAHAPDRPDPPPGPASSSRESAHLRLNVWSIEDGKETTVTVSKDHTRVTKALVKQLHVDPPFGPDLPDDETWDENIPLSLEFPVDELRHTASLIVSLPHTPAPALIIPTKDVISAGCDRIDVFIQPLSEPSAWLCSARCAGGTSYAWAGSLNFPHKCPVGFHTKSL